MILKECNINDVISFVVLHFGTCLSFRIALIFRLMHNHHLSYFQPLMNCYNTYHHNQIIETKFDELMLRIPSCLLGIIQTVHIIRNLKRQRLEVKQREECNVDEDDDDKKKMNNPCM